MTEENGRSGTAVFRDNLAAISTENLWIWIWMANFISTASLTISAERISSNWLSFSCYRA